MISCLCVDLPQGAQWCSYCCGLRFKVLTTCCLHNEPVRPHHRLTLWFFRICRLASFDVNLRFTLSSRKALWTTSPQAWLYFCLLLFSISSAFACRFKPPLAVISQSTTLGLSPWGAEERLEALKCQKRWDDSLVVAPHLPLLVLPDENGWLIAVLRAVHPKTRASDPASAFPRPRAGMQAHFLCIA